MIAYDLKMTLASCKRSPWLTTLTVLIVAAGISASIVTIALHKARSGHPIWWKEDRLFAVALDVRSMDPEFTKYAKHPENPPALLSYRDARALYESDIPKRSAIMFKARRIVEPQREGVRPFRAMVRVTTPDLFSMFDVPFIHGGGWTREAEKALDRVAVISKRISETLFGASNAVGQSIVLSGIQYRVVGVVDSWMPQPKFYDLNNATFDSSEEIFIPFETSVAMQIPTGGLFGCYASGVKIGSYDAILASDCVWTQFWAELDTPEQYARFAQFADNYVNEQKRYGRFPRPLNNRVLSVSEWLKFNDVVGDESRVQMIMASIFLLVCIVNTAGLMLARFSSVASVTGIRRALGATRGDIVRQHLVEVACICLAGGVLGLCLAFLGLWLVRAMLYMPMMISLGSADALQIAQSLSQLDWNIGMLALTLSLVAGLLAGLYPAWRIGRTPPASFLKI